MNKSGKGSRARQSGPVRFLAAAAAVLGIGGPAAAVLVSCAPVPQREREYLADPIMQRIPDQLGHDLESHNLPRREGSTGGSSGSGGGCGC